MSGARLRLIGCAKTFANGTQALRPTDLDVPAGEVLALLGPSGCGKTTTLRLLAGLEAPDAGGRIRFDDDDVTAVPIERRQVGMVFQSYALFPNMSVAGNVGYGLRIRGIGGEARAARVAEVLRLCRIEELADRRVQELSGGQRQRVALARAIAVPPRALLLDEPLSALDAGLRETLRDELAALLRELSITTVVVTHDQGEAMAIADRVAVMERGRVLQVAPPRELYARPATAFVARFVGGANALGGRVEAATLVLPGGRLPLPPDQDGLVWFARPGAFRLTAPDQAPLVGIVQRVTFLGDRQRLVVDGVLQGPLTVDAPAEPALQPGERVGLAIGAEGLLGVPEA